MAPAPYPPPSELSRYIRYPKSIRWVHYDIENSPIGLLLRIGLGDTFWIFNGKSYVIWTDFSRSGSSAGRYLKWLKRREKANFHGLSLWGLGKRQSQFVWVNLKTFICFEDFGDFNPIGDSTHPNLTTSPFTQNKPVHQRHTRKLWSKEDSWNRNIKAFESLRQKE